MPMTTPPPPATILVVDDDLQLREMLREVLETAGHRVLTAPHGGEGWRLTNLHAPQLVVTDIVMPDHEGIEFITRLLTMPDRPRIIAISGGFASSVFYLQTARVFGADSTLAKPFLPAQMLDEVARLLHNEPGPAFAPLPVSFA